MNKTQDAKVFEAYKPLRNAIRKLGLTDSLAVIRAYVADLQLNQEIPSNCQVHPNYRFAQTLHEKRAWISEFHLETLCREVILNAAAVGQAPETLRNWNTLGKTINLLKKLEGVLANRYSTPELLMKELHRMAHRQFPWQAFRPTAVNITRYHMIYGRSPLSDIIHRATGLSPEELFLYGMALLGNFMNTFSLTFPPSIEIPGLSPDGLDRFLTHFSRTLTQLKGLLTSEQQMNDRYSYSYHSLRAYPLIRIEYRGRESIVCPIPTLLFWRFTSGVYYEIYNQPGFNNAFGQAFQWYVGEVIAKGTARERTRLYPECTYRVGKDLKSTVDWIVEQEGVALFVEAKTKRLAYEAKVEIVQEDALSIELDKLAAMIVQVYKTIADYRANKYPTYRYDPQRRIYPIVLTLEDWFLMGPNLVNKVKEDVSRRMAEEGLPLTFLEEMPFSVCSIHEFEQAIQIMDQVGILTVMQTKIDTNRGEWTLSAFIREAFKTPAKEARFLFQSEFNTLGVEITGECNQIFE